MNASRLRAILVLFALFTCSTLAFATTPKVINYQGYLKNTDGTPVSTLVSVTFRLYTQPSEGTPIWAETMGVIPENGIYSVVLGKDSSLDSSVFDSNSLYLGVQVASEAEMTTRQQITSTPYAFRADIADNVSSTASLSTVNQIISNVATGTPPLQVDSTTLVPNLNADMLDGKHAADFIDTTSGQIIAGTKSFSSTIGGSISGNAATVTNGIYNGGNSGAVSVGTSDNNPLELIANNVQVMKFDADVNGANITAGYSGNIVTPGVNGAIIGGGGGYLSENKVTDSFGTVSGGINNQAGDNAGTTSDNLYATVAGGVSNTASGYGSAVGGGNSNTASGIYSFVGGGYTNIASGQSAAIPGGSNNSASGMNSFAAGNLAQAEHTGTFVWSDGTTFASTAPGQFLVKAFGGVGINKNKPTTALDVDGTVTATAFSGSGAALTSVDSGNLTGTLSDARLSANVAKLDTAQTFSAAKTFSTAPSFSASSGTPFSVMSSTAVTNLNADQLDGQHGTYFLNASNLNSGTLNDNLLSANIAKLGTAQTFTMPHIFSINTLVLAGSAGGFTTLSNAASTSRSVTLPDATGTVITTGNLTGITATGNIASGIWNGTNIAAVRGGTGVDTSGAAAGSMLRATGIGTWSLLSPGSNGQVLQMSGGAPAWGNTSLSAGTGISLSPSPITTAGFISINTTVVPQLAAPNIFTAGTQTIQTGAAGTTGLVVRGASGQTAILQGWQTNTGSTVASISADGDITSNTGNIYLPATSSAAGAVYVNNKRLMHSYGSNNFFAGSGAGNFTMTGMYNTAAGGLSLAANTTGESNVANGHSALASNTTGGWNTAIGIYSLYHNTTANLNTAVGGRALLTQSFDNGGVSWNSYNTAVGYGALYNNQPTMTSEGIYNTALGADSGGSNTIGSFNTFLGYSSDANSNNLTNATAIGYNASVDVSNKVRIGNTSVTVIGGQVAWSNLSDIRQKEDITDVRHGLEFIRQLRPVEYRMIEGNGRKDFGFIAQDIEALLGTDYNLLSIGGDAERRLSLRYTDFIAPMVKAMQEQQATIDQLKAELAEIRKLLGR
ncbi:MAG: tail fiber domain-containing protein [Geobacteraceae bacterium]|nr:tail fiber domain-containing protein [Geobacteraceae bacterium]